MGDQKTEYERRAAEYEEKAKRVTDPWMREKHLKLAKYCRERKRVPARQEEATPQTAIVSRRKGIGDQAI